MAHISALSGITAVRESEDETLSMFRDSVRKFMEAEVQPNAARWREQKYVNKEVFKKAGDQGFLCLWANEKYGGMGIDDWRFERVLEEEQARVDSKGFFLGLHSRIVAPYIGTFGTEDQKSRYLTGAVSGETILAIAMTEPGAGSDLAGMRSTAIDKGDHWLLNGQKTYISNGQICDLVIVAAKTDPENPRAIGLFLVEAAMDGFERGQNLDKMGMDANDTSELFFTDVKIPKTNELGDPKKGFRCLMAKLAEERLFATFGNLAWAEFAFDETINFVKDRKVFGEALSQMQNTRFKLGELRSRLDMMQAFTDRMIEMANNKSLGAELAASAKLLSSELLGDMVDEGVQLHGGAGYMEEYPICRAYRDARVHRILAGTSEIMKEIVARKVLDGN